MVGDEILKKISEYCEDNVKVNWTLTPVYVLIALAVIKLRTDLSWFFWGNPFKSVLGVTAISTLVYLYVSKFFQPDLDHPSKRPGMSIFPLFGGWHKYLLKIKIKIPKTKHVVNFGAIIIFLIRPVTFLWDSLWGAFARFFTHRGVVHWPVWGVWLRVWWLMIFYYSFQFGFMMIAGDVIRIPYFANWLNSFFPWDRGFESVFFYSFCFPVYLSDIIHTFGDFVGTKLKGLPFLNNMQQRGLLHKSLYAWQSRWRFIKKQINKFKG